MVTQFPTLDSGVTYLDDGGAPTALYRLVGSQLSETAGPAYWVDARNAARPDAIDEYTNRRSGRSLRIARAFTAFQHYELVRSLPATASQRTSLVVVPNVASLYVEDDVPEHEADAMFDATLSLLDALAEAVDVPVVVTASERTDRVEAAADRTLKAEDTRAGLRVDGPSYQTDVYWHDWGIQTTIPYWVDLFGAVDADGEQEAVDPMALGV
jgi:hypothetical protein